MKQYRQDAHVLPLVIWAVLCVALAIFLFVHGHRIVSRVLRTEEIAAGVGLLIVGPVTLTVYLVRARKVWVEVDPGQGIVVSGKRIIPWDQVCSIERRRPRFRRTTGPAEGDILEKTGGCVDPGCGGCVDVASVGEAFAVIGFILAALVALWLLVMVVIPLFLIPLVEVFAPFGDRIKIVWRGRSIVLRDLREADEFVRLVSAHKPVVER
jgi:hypothetical protein